MSAQEPPAQQPGESAAQRLLRASSRREIVQLPNSALVDRDYEQDIKLKKWYGLSVLIGLGAQLLIANSVFIVYASLGVDWKLEPSVIQVWLAATVVEVVGVVLVVTRYLFPKRDTQGRGTTLRRR